MRTIERRPQNHVLKKRHIVFKRWEAQPKERQHRRLHEVVEIVEMELVGTMKARQQTTKANKSNKYMQIVSFTLIWSCPEIRGP